MDVKMDLDAAKLPLLVNVCMSSIATAVLFNIIPKFKEMFFKAGLFGIDMNKVVKQPHNMDTPSEKPKL